MPMWQKPLSLSLGCCVGGRTLLSTALLLFTVTIIFISINFTPSPLGSFVWLLPGPGDIWVQAPGPGPFSLLTLLASRIRAAGWLVEAHLACEQWTDDSDQVSPLSKSTLVFPLWSNYHWGKAVKCHCFSIERVHSYHLLWLTMKNLGFAVQADCVDILNIYVCGCMCVCGCVCLPFCFDFHKVIVLLLCQILVPTDNEVHSALPRLLPTTSLEDNLTRRKDAWAF